MGSELSDRGSIPGRRKIFFSTLQVQTGPPFPGQSDWDGSGIMELYFHSAASLQGVVLSYLNSETTLLIYIYSC
jgi:hypothetical protein